MEDSLNLENLKREPRWSTWEEDAPTVNSEPTVTWGTDGNSTPVTTEASQMAAGASRAAEAASSPEGLLESLAGSASASVTPASSATTTDRIPAIPVSTSSSSAVSESTTQPTITATSTFSTASPETTMTLTGTVVSTTSAVDTATAAPGAYSGGGDSVKNKLAIALPIAIVGLLIILALVFFFVRRRRRRTARPPYEMSGSETPGVSTAALMATTPRTIAPPEPAATSLHRLPVIDITSSPNHETTPGSATARSEDDPRTELGIAVAVPIDQRLSATEHDLREFSRPVSSVSRRATAGPPSAGLASVRMPFENQSSDENDAVSIISGEHGRTDHERDFDDMSSVSSFDDDHPPIETHGQSFR